MAQFKAEAGKEYINPTTGQRISYTADQLKDPAQGFLSSQFQLAPVGTGLPTPQQTIPQPVAPTTGQQALETVLSKYLPTGLATSSDLESAFTTNLTDEFTRIAKEREAQLRAEADTAKREAMATGEARLGGLTGITTQANQGVGFSSVEQSLVQRQQAENDKALRNIDEQLNKAVLDNDTNLAEQLKGERAERRQAAMDLFNMQMSMLNARLGIAQEARAAATSEFNIIKDIPVGETITVGGQTYTGIKPTETEDAFFKGSDIINFMKSIPAGQTQSLTDPVTGMTWNLTGTSEPETVQATADDGSISFINKVTGEIITKTKPGVGKTKTAPMSIILNQQTAGLLGAASESLESSKGTDGNFNTDTYIQERNRFATSGGDVNVFDKTYSYGLNSNDPKAQRFLQTKDIPEEGEEPIEITTPSGATIKL